MDATFMIAGVTIPVFSFSLVCGTLLGMGMIIRRTGWRLGSVIDLALGAGIVAVIGGRVEHVALQWAYFSTARDEIARFTLGGLEWHGAVVGGLIGLWVALRVKNLWTQRRKGAKDSAEYRVPSAEAVLAAVALVIPVLAFAGWVGCYAAPCAWGKEVTTLADYPSWAVGWTRDVFNIYAPRYNTQLYGMALAMVLFVLAWIPVLRSNGNLQRTARMPSPQYGAVWFWLVLALLSIGMFFIGYWRADSVPMWFGLRADQVLDGILAGVVVSVMIISRTKQERG